MKRVVALVLALVMVVSAAFPVFADSDDFIIDVPCASNCSDMNSIRLLVHKNRFYISGEDAAELSMSTFTDSSVGSFFDKPGWGKIAAENEYRLIDRCWFPLERTMESLNTMVEYGFPIGADEVGILMFRTKLHSTDELSSATKRIMITERSRYEVKDMTGISGKIGKAFAVLSNLLSGKAMSYATGSYDKEMYESIFSDLITLSDDQYTDLSDVLHKGDQLMSNISETLMYYEDYLLTKELGEKAFSELSSWDKLDEIIILDDGLSDWGKVFAMYDTLTDPIGTLIENKSGVKIKGLDFGSIFSTCVLYEDAIKANQTMVMMINETFCTSDEAYARVVGTPDTMDRALNSVMPMFNSDSGYESLAAALGYTLSNSIEKSFDEYGTGLLEDILSNQTFKLSKKFSLKFESSLKHEVSVAVARFITEKFCPDVFKKMEFVEKSLLVTSIQKRVLDLYEYFIADDKYALNSKYAALMYVRCAQVNNAYRLENDPAAANIYNAADEQYRDAIGSLLAFSDWDITTVIKNEHISVADVLADHPDRVVSADEPVIIIPDQPVIDEPMIDEPVIDEPVIDEPNPGYEQDDDVMDLIGIWSIEDDNYFVDLFLNENGTFALGCGEPYTEFASLYTGRYTISDYNLLTLTFEKCTDLATGHSSTCYSQDNGNCTIWKYRVEPIGGGKVFTAINSPDSFDGLYSTDGGYSVHPVLESGIFYYISESDAHVSVNGQHTANDKPISSSGDYLMANYGYNSDLARGDSRIFFDTLVYGSAIDVARSTQGIIGRYQPHGFYNEYGPCVYFFLDENGRIHTALYGYASAAVEGEEYTFISEIDSKYTPVISPVSVCGANTCGEYIVLYEDILSADDQLLRSKYNIFCILRDDEDYSRFSLELCAGFDADFANETLTIETPMVESYHNGNQLEGTIVQYTDIREMKDDVLTLEETLEAMFLSDVYDINEPLYNYFWTQDEYIGDSRRYADFVRFDYYEE